MPDGGDLGSMLARKPAGRPYIKGDEDGRCYFVVLVDFGISCFGHGDCKMRLIVCILILIFSSPVFSQDFSQCTDLTANVAYCHTESQAKRYARLSAEHFARKSANLAVCPRDYHNSQSKRYDVRVIDTQNGNNDCNYYVAVYSRVYFDSHADYVCPPGGAPKPGYPGECITSEDCLAKNSEGRMGGVRPWFNRCLKNGCEIAFDPNGDDYVKTTIGNKVMHSGTIEYTGKVCGVPDNWAPEQPDKPKPPELPESEQNNPPKEECTVMGTQTACVKPDGNVCAKASTGREICWKPGQVGTKTDRNVVQQKKPGEVSMPPSISIDNGDTANKSKDDITIKEQFSGGRTSTSTIGTYETASGADAGGSNHGQPGGQPGGKPGGKPGGQEGGEGDGDGNSSSGGTNCGSPPVSTGDSLLAQIAYQAWETRCQFDRLDEAGSRLGAGDGEGDGDGNADDVWNNDDKHLDFDTSRISLSGGGVGQTTFEVDTFKFTIPEKFWDIISAIRWLVIAMAYLIGLRIVFGG